MIFRRLLFLAFIVTLAAGCAPTVGVRWVGAQANYREMNTNVLFRGEPSAASRQYLQRLSLIESWEKEPEQAVAELHRGLGGIDEHDRLFALAELSLVLAQRRNDPSHYRASAVYAYAFLFPGDGESTISSYDPRVRLAMDIYNRSLAEGLREDTDKINLTPRNLSLPFGTLSVAGNPYGFEYGNRKPESFVSLSDYRASGLRNSYRTPGIGMILSANLQPSANSAGIDHMGPRSKAPLTAVLRMDQPRKSLQSGQIRGTLELYEVSHSPRVTIGNEEIPLESNPSLAMAYDLHGSQLYDFRIAGFRRGDLRLFGELRDQSIADGDLFFMTPYAPGRIPVVLVHGTASSPATWAQMVNDLCGDPRIAQRYQFWLFLYNSGNPVALSSLQLRESLQSAIKSIDPAGRDAALQQMVVVGHSQGGLLTKMTSVSSGDRFWKQISQSKFEMVTLSEESKDLLQRGLFVEPLPFVKRLVFISTPHQGSFLAENWAGKFARKFVSLPANITRMGTELIALNPSAAKETALRIPTSIDNMDWSNPFLRTLASLPIAPGVRVNSIIPVKQADKPLAECNDGVVRYSSAHIPGVESELVIRGCNHSAQENPRAIEEVRRILYEHAEIQESI